MRNGAHVIALAANSTKGREDMPESEQTTGVTDNVYNLSSMLFHAAEGSQVYD